MLPWPALFQLAATWQGLDMKKWLHENRGFLLLLLCLGLFRGAVADWNPIPSGSMHPNLLEGDVVLVNRLAYDVKVPLSNISIARLGDPQRGDIVTFWSPADGKRLIKRVAALPGDTVTMHNKMLTINGRAATYTPLGEGQESVGHSISLRTLRLEENTGPEEHEIQWLQHSSLASNFGPLTLPKDQYLMLGDNRDNSADSRYIGLVPRRLLIGKAEGVLASANITGNWMPRFDRFGKSLY